MRRHRLKISSARAKLDLRRFCSDIYDENCKWRLSSKYLVGEGRIFDRGIDQEITIGVGGLLHESFFQNFSIVSDLDFVSVKVTAAHEYRHYLQNIGEVDFPEIHLSRMSVVGNNGYYMNFWNELPHEIDAEWDAVGVVWDDFAVQRPKIADAVMLEYINYRANETKYFLSPSDDGYKSRNQVMEAFEKAYCDSIEGQRSLCSTLRAKSPITGKRDKWIQYMNLDGTPYDAEKPWMRVFLDVVGERNGAKRDLMMCSVMAHIDSELAKDFPVLADIDLSSASVFGRPFPDEKPQVRMRPVSERFDLEPMIIRPRAWPIRQGPEFIPGSGPVEGAGARCVAAAEEMNAKDDKPEEFGFT